MTSQNTVAIVFDFDDTLGPDSTSGFLDSLGVDVPKFWQETTKLLDNCWDPVPAYLYKMIQLAQSSDTFITKKKLEQFGKTTPLYPGALEIFDKLRAYVKDYFPEIRLEFYIISSGIEEIIRNTPIASNFTDIWGGDFAYDEEDRILFPKRIVSFTDKTRYIFNIRKGLIGEKFRKEPFEVNRKYTSNEIRIPINQMIFIGDGYTDIPCFSLIGKAGGIPLAVCDTVDRDKWGRAWGFMEDKRVIHWATANYSEGSTLYASLMMALDTIAKKIIIKNRSYQG